MFLVDKAGRKILLLISGALMFLSSGSVGIFFYLQSKEMSGGLGAMPLVGLIFFMIGYSIGFASVPFVLLGELLPSKYRNLLGGISSSFNLLNTFLVIKLFTNIQESVLNALQ
jgi:facilitated trehalose transporter